MLRGTVHTLLETPQSHPPHGLASIDLTQQVSNVFGENGSTDTSMVNSSKSNTSQAAYLPELPPSTFYEYSRIARARISNLM